jgi:hypothetical protein
MSPPIGLPPAPAERGLDTPRKSRYRGGTLIAGDMHDFGEHQRTLADIDAHRPEWCATCGHSAMHVHTRPERHPLREPSLPPVVCVLQFRRASVECGATWRVLPLFLARHVWHAWKAVERAVSPDAKLASRGAPEIRPRTAAR